MLALGSRKKSGGMGLNATFGNEVKILLSSQNINSHVTLISMGVIPSMVANNVQLGVKQFAAFDPKSSMEAIASIQNATVAGQTSVSEAADAARTGLKTVSLKAAEIKAALSALGDIDDGQNKILDINSDDGARRLSHKNERIRVRSPINYYLKNITKCMLAEMWVAKYSPEKYTAIQNDDTEPAKKADNPTAPAQGTPAST